MSFRVKRATLLTGSLSYCKNGFKIL